MGSSYRTIPPEAWDRPVHQPHQRGQSGTGKGQSPFPTPQYLYVSRKMCEARSDQKNTLKISPLWKLVIPAAGQVPLAVGYRLDQREAGAGGPTGGHATPCGGDQGLCRTHEAPSRLRGGSPRSFLPVLRNYGALR